MANVTSITPAAPVVSLVDGKPVTTTQNVAAVFGKRHGHVIRAIRNLNCSPEFTETNFGLSEYVDSTGRKVPNYTITRDGCAFLVMGFTGTEAAKFKESYIAAFNAMEAALHQPALPSPPLTPEHARRLQEAVATRAMSFPTGERHAAFAKLWGGIKTQFSVPGYRELPDARFDDAVRYVSDVNLSPSLPALPPPDSLEHYQRCLKMAISLSATVQQEVFESLSQRIPEEVARHRFMVSMGRENKPHVHIIESDSLVSSLARLPQMLGDSGMMVTDTELTAIAKACLDRLTRRAAHKALEKAA